jgi:hypothetical protein
MTREQGIKQIDEARWTKDDPLTLDLRVNDKDGNEVHAWLMMRPPYCDRGHIQLNIEGQLNLDWADNFPRYFFNPVEADLHTRNCLKWRLWNERAWDHEAITRAFEAV